jgi:hypothetical protein
MSNYYNYCNNINSSSSSSSSYKSSETDAQTQTQTHTDTHTDATDYSSSSSSSSSHMRSLTPISTHTDENDGIEVENQMGNGPPTPIDSWCDIIQELADFVPEFNEAFLTEFFQE